MTQLLIQNATVINEGHIKQADVLIRGERIEKISENIQPKGNYACIDASGLYLLPGMIDAHVHFRTPGLTNKADIASESKAAVAGGVTSYFDMPNTLPNTTHPDLLDEKYRLASGASHANFSFYFGLNHKNLDHALRIDPATTCGLTDDGLYFADEHGGLCNRIDYLEQFFSRCDTRLALHCEDESTIAANLRLYELLYPGMLPAQRHSKIRSEGACVKATSRVIELAQKTKGRVHILHVSTELEALLIGQASLATQQRITGEVCVHHLYFSELDYETYGPEIIWNPSIKSEENRKGLLAALQNNHLQIIATDHAPHRYEEKMGPYRQIKPGAPSIQHALPALLHLFGNTETSLPFIADKTSHSVAKLFNIHERGFIREGYYADLVVINLNDPTHQDELFYKCQWSPFANIHFGNAIVKTIVNGALIYDKGTIVGEKPAGKRLLFNNQKS